MNTYHRLRSFNTVEPIALVARECAWRRLVARVSGVVARRTLPSGTIVARRCEFRVVSTTGRAPPGDYRVDVTRNLNLVGKPDARSFGPPVDGVANVGSLLNEATTRSAVR